MAEEREHADLAKELIAQTIRKQSVDSAQLTIHADRGSSMTSKAVAFLLADLGVTKTHSRPHVSNDNPYSEAHFKTLKYRPEFPERFGSVQHARDFCRRFFDWYDNRHRHSGIAMMTPVDVHSGRRALRSRQRDRRPTRARARRCATPQSRTIRARRSGPAAQASAGGEWNPVCLALNPQGMNARLA